MSTTPYSRARRASFRPSRSPRADRLSRAQAAYTKAGFSREGILRHAWFQDGHWSDDIRMSLLRDEWAALPRRKSWERVEAAIAERSADE